jgi:hypothetical protein
MWLRPCHCPWTGDLVGLRPFNLAKMKLVSSHFTPRSKLHEMKRSSDGPNMTELGAHFPSTYFDPFLLPHPLFFLSSPSFTLLFNGTHGSRGLMPPPAYPLPQSVEWHYSFQLRSTESPTSVQPPLPISICYGKKRNTQVVFSMIFAWILKQTSRRCWPVAQAPFSWNGEIFGSSIEVF